MSKRTRNAKRREGKLGTNLSDKVNRWVNLIRCALLVIIPAIATYLTTFFLFRPKVVVAPNVTLDDSTPFSTAFTVSNSGELFALRDVQAGCNGKVTYRATRPQTANPVVLLGYTPREKLDSGDAFTVPCIGGLKENPNAALAIDEAHITMVVAYSVLGIPMRFRREVPYTLAQSTDGRFHWLPE